MNTQELSTFSTLLRALDAKAAVGEQVTFWLRDDDAVEPSEPLSQLLELCEFNKVPLTLAVIPEHTGDALVHRLDSVAGVSVAVHGWSHTNHAPQGGKKCELGDDRPIDQVLAELERGFTKLSALHGSEFVPLLVPPWNRITQNVLGQLHTLGFSGVSTFGVEKPTAVKMINTQVDVIYAKGGNGVREASELVADIVEQLQAGRSTIGILTHHLVHTPVTWDFLQQALALLQEHRAVRWVSVSDLLSTAP